MTNSEIAKAIAEKVMGWKPASRPVDRMFPDGAKYTGWLDGKRFVREGAYDPADDIGYAIEALEKWLHVGTHRSYELRQAQSGAYGPQATVWNPDKLPVRASCSADTLSMAISRALLASHGIEA